MESESLAILRGIRDGWRRSLENYPGPKTRVGPFLTTFNPTNDLVWLNYAVPVEEAGESELRDAMPALEREFAKQNRALRFEFLEDLSPQLATILESMGLKLQAKLPAMAITAGELRPASKNAVRVEWITADSDDASLREFATVGNRAFGQDGDVDQQRVNETREFLRRGTRSVAGHIDDKIAGIASLTPGGDVSELAGVGTLPEFRRMNIARTLSEFLCRDHFDRRGSAVWLSAGDSIARAVYEKVGFRFVGTQLNYIKERAPASEVVWTNAARCAVRESDSADRSDAG